METDAPRMTGPTLKVLVSLLESPRDEMSGADIAKRSKLASGTLYPILLRLEKAGWLESRWETEDPQTMGRPRRRYYRVTGVGARQARAAISDVQTTMSRLSWA